MKKNLKIRLAQVMTPLMLIGGSVSAQQPPAKKPAGQTPTQKTQTKKPATSTKPSSGTPIKKPATTTNTKTAAQKAAEEKKRLEALEAERLAAEKKKLDEERAAAEEKKKQEAEAKRKQQQEDYKVVELGKGKIIDKLTGEPVEFVLLSVCGTSIGAQIPDGNFNFSTYAKNLKGLPAGTPIALCVNSDFKKISPSSEGYENGQIILSKVQDLKNLTILMEDVVQHIQEVVVVAAVPVPMSGKVIDSVTKSAVSGAEIKACGGKKIEQAAKAKADKEAKEQAFAEARAKAVEDAREQARNSGEEFDEAEFVASYNEENAEESEEASEDQDSEGRTTQTWIESGTSDMSGQYNLKLSADHYRDEMKLCVSAPGYHSVQLDLPSKELAKAGDAHIRLNQIEKTVSGKVVDINGNPVAGVSINACINATTTATERTHAVSDAEGNYSLSALYFDAMTPTIQLCAKAQGFYDIDFNMSELFSQEKQDITVTEIVRPLAKSALKPYGIKKYDSMSNIIKNAKNFIKNFKPKIIPMPPPPPMTVGDWVTEALANLRSNLSDEPFQLEGLYREYYKQGHQLWGSIETVGKIFDKGINVSDSETEISVDVMSTQRAGKESSFDRVFNNYLKELEAFRERSQGSMNAKDSFLGNVFKRSRSSSSQTITKEEAQAREFGVTLASNFYRNGLYSLMRLNPIRNFDDSGLSFLNAIQDKVADQEKEPKDEEDEETGDSYVVADFDATPKEGSQDLFVTGKLYINKRERALTRVTYSVSALNNAEGATQSIDGTSSSKKIKLMDVEIKYKRQGRFMYLEKIKYRNYIKTAQPKSALSKDNDKVGDKMIDITHHREFFAVGKVKTRDLEDLEKTLVEKDVNLKSLTGKYPVNGAFWKGPYGKSGFDNRLDVLKIMCNPDGTMKEERTGKDYNCAHFKEISSMKK